MQNRDGDVSGDIKALNGADQLVQRSNSRPKVRSEFSLKSYSVLDSFARNFP